MLPLTGRQIQKCESGVSYRSSNVSRSGFTLVELMVAMTLFLTVMALSSGVFMNTLRTQKEVAALTAANANISQAIEQMAREVRTGKEFGASLPSELSFTNYKAEKVGYKLLTGGTLGRCVETALLPCSALSSYKSITSDKVLIEDIKFAYVGELDADGLPARITISIKVKGFKGTSNYFQTTMSSKILEE